MTKKYNILDKAQLEADFRYVYSPNCKVFRTFKFEENAIAGYYDNEIENYDYISVVTKEKCASGTTATTKCLFEKFGAPLIVFTDDITNDGKVDRYGLHFEVVVYEKGINVWHIVPMPERKERPVNPTLIAHKEFAIAGESIIDLAVKVEGKKISIVANGEVLEVEHDDVPANFHIGVTACEGVNRFYSFEIEE